MIEELTTQVMMSSLLLIIITASFFTFLLSAILLYLYRRKVILVMNSAGGFNANSQIKDEKQFPGYKEGLDVHKRFPLEIERLYQRAITAPWLNLLRYAISGFLFALVFAIAAHFVYPSRLELPGFLIGVWIYAWPIILSLILIVPESVQKCLFYILGYFFIFSLLSIWAGTITNLPEYRFGGVYVPARSSVTPMGMTKLWLAVNAAPSFLVWICFNRWIRAVAPLVLAFVVITLSGIILFWLFGLYSKTGVDATVGLSVLMDIHVYYFILAAFILSLMFFGIPGWVFSRWIGRAYHQRWFSDQSLMLDAMWLLFAVFYGMWLVRGGLGWIAVAPTAFLVYRVTLEIIARIHNQSLKPACGLIFLRVFSLGRRREALLDTVAKFWRYLGSIQMITGPDVAKGTVQPHQFLDFLNGQLNSHFVSDQTSLTRRLAEQNCKADVDNRYRINNFFCHKDSWQSALLALVNAGDIVLMDLRNFTATNKGCIHELRLLIHKVQLNRFILVVDNTTDESFLDSTIRQCWKELRPDSPNYNRAPTRIPLFRYRPGLNTQRRLIYRLCTAVSMLNQQSSINNDRIDIV